LRWPVSPTLPTCASEPQLTIRSALLTPPWRPVRPRIHRERHTPSEWPRRRSYEVRSRRR
jgi:hypothetical protein